MSKHLGGVLTVMFGLSLEQGFWKQLRRLTPPFSPSYTSVQWKKSMKTLTGGRLLHHQRKVLNNVFIARRRKVLANVIPEGFLPCVSTAEGNCLFCAVSLLLFGSEDYHKDLRFAAVHYALMHFDHYLEMVRSMHTDLNPVIS